jgi:hypothetical protein
MDTFSSLRPDSFNKMVLIITDLLLIINKDETYMSIQSNQKEDNIDLALEHIVSRNLQNYLNTNTNQIHNVQSFFEHNQSQCLIQINKLLLKMEANELSNILNVIHLISGINRDSKEIKSIKDSISCKDTQVTYSPPKKYYSDPTNLSELDNVSKKKQKIDHKQEKQKERHFTFSLEEIASFTTKTSWQPNTFKLSNHKPDKSNHKYNTPIQTVDTKTKLINAANLFKCKKLLYIFFIFSIIIIS